MTQATYFRTNRPDVISESFDDEVVLLNVENGTYYSLDQVAADIWVFIENGATVNETIEGITQRYEGDQTVMERATRQFVSELQQEGLIVPDETKEAGSDHGPNVHAQAGQDTAQPAFTAPVLRRYTDMQELLMLDPIHDVAETGWPSARPDDAREDG